MFASIKQHRTASTHRTAVILMAIGALIMAPFLFHDTAGAAACVAPSADLGQVTTSANAPSAATYRIWTRMQVPDATNNTFLLEIDGNKCYTVGGAGTTLNSWTWVSYQNGNKSSNVDVPLTAGAHTVRMIGNKPNVKVDRVIFVSDLTCVPTGLGDNCKLPADTTAPSTKLTNPVSSATVSGSAVALSATVTDAGGVGRAEFYVDGVNVTNDTSAPYTATWDSTKVTNGVHAVSVRGYDISGNMSTSSATVTVKNGDAQSPTMPLNVNAKVISSTKIQLSWSPSVDNVGVANYRIYKNGLPVANVTGSTTQYEDTGVVPQTSYNYQVEASDAAGNRSTLSAKATVTTPSTPVVDTTAPSRPQNLVVTVAGTSQMNLTWLRSTDNIAVAGYDIYRSKAQQNPTKVGSSKETSFGDTGLENDTSYSYFVIAKDVAGNQSAKSEVVTNKTTAVTSSTWRVSGMVTSQRGDRLPAVRMIVIKNGLKGISQSNRSGWYAVNELDNGTYALIAYKDGFRLTTQKVTIKNANLLKQNVVLQRQ